MKKTFAILLVAATACSRQAAVTSSPGPQTATAPGRTPSASAADIVRANATINDVTNTRIGSATFADTPAGLLVSITATGLGIGPHGAHLHTVGACVTPTFATAGAHFNPGGKQHGFRNPAGHHAGDMPNIVSPPAGTHTVQFLLDGVRLTGRGGLLDDDGASIVIHSYEDDHLTDPSGNSAARFACGVIALVK